MFTLNTLTDLCMTKQSIKKKKYFCMNCSQCFITEEILTNHKKVRLETSGKQCVNRPKTSSKEQLNNCHKQL